MSFGFGIGDFLAVFELASKIRDKWADAPVEYKSIKDETKNMVNILRDIGDLGNSMDLSAQHEESLTEVCQRCRGLLEECEIIVQKYSSVQENTSTRFKVRRAWTRLKVDSDEIRHLRDRVSAQVAQLDLLHGIIETALIIDVSEGVQDLQLNDAQREKLIVADWYSSADFADQQTDQLSRQENGTGGWFLAHPEYQHWREHMNGTLLCPGIPGSGKSMMVATVVNDLQTQFATGKDVAIAYIYCNFNRQTEQDLSRMLAVLIRQLFQEQARLPECVMDLYRTHRDRATRPSVEAFKHVLRLLVTSYQRIFVVIDALDECSNSDQQRDRLLAELFYLQKQQSQNVNVLVTTRFIPDIIRQFSAHPRIEIRADEGDIGRYLKNRMSGLSRFVTRNPQLQADIMKQITDAAKGMFLLARLQFDSLRDKTNLGQMEDALADLSNNADSLKTAYDDALKRVESQLEGWRALARKVILWITYAKRALLVEELQEAIAVQPGRRDLELNRYLDDEDQIVSVCHGLVEIDQESRVIRLVHYTAQEYFEVVHNEWLADGHLHITRACITYLKMDMFAHDQRKWNTDLSSVIRQHKFLEYAGKNWGIHACAVHDEELEAEIEDFLSNADDSRLAAQIAIGQWFGHPGDKYYCLESDISAVHISTYFQLRQVLQNIIRNGEDVNQRDGEGKTALAWAALEGLTGMVELLLTQPGIEVNTTDEHGHTPLEFAVQHGKTDIAQLLLVQPRIEVNAKDYEGVTPLFAAAEDGNIEVARLLLAHPSVDVNAKNDETVTPLFQAILFDHLEIVQLLLAHPQIDVNLHDKYGNTPLSFAAELGRIEATTLLLASPGIIVDTRTGRGRTPLSLAAEGGHEEIVELFLAHPGVSAQAKAAYKEAPSTPRTK